MSIFKRAKHKTNQATQNNTGDGANKSASTNIQDSYTSETKTPKPKVVIIGSGISGLASAWLLQQSNQYDVTLLESQNRYGGHANAVPITLNKKQAKVDTGFLVFNHKTYPHLTHFFHHLNVKICDSDMSFGLSVKKRFQRIEWAGTSLSSVFAQRRRLLSPSHWRMVLDIVRMEKQADNLLKETENQNITLGELLKTHKYSTSFTENYLLPMAAAIWSTSVEDIRLFPAQTFLRFCKNHVLLDISGRPQWKTVDHTSAQYVSAVISQLDDARKAHKVIAIEKLCPYAKSNSSNTNKKYKISFEHNGQTDFIQADIIISACHTDTAHKLFAKVATDSQLNILKSIKYAPNTAYLHTDKKQMPKSKKVWSSWNYLAEKVSDKNTVTVSYWLNKLQPYLPFKQDVFVTLNPIHPIKPSKILNTFHYDHPQINQQMVEAQKQLPIVQGDNQLYFAGAWTRYGFHEDGILSAVTVTSALGVKTPWQVPTDWDENYEHYAKELNQFS